jgi:regulator of RNase E activity RraA
MVGYAVTAKIRAATAPSQELPHQAVWAEFEKVPRPWVVVVEDDDYPDCLGSYWGEVNASVYAALGAVGAVTNGGVRDLPEVRATGFQFFSASVLVSHAYAHVVEAGEPVTVGGLIVHPGDLLHGDEHGVTSVPHEIAVDLSVRCKEIEAAERRLIDYARSGDVSMEELARRYGEAD